MWPHASPAVVLAAAAALAVPAGPAGGRSTVLRRPPSLGVACRTAASIACDRVGLAVWLRGPAIRVTARVNGRALRLRPAPWRAPAPWIGYLRPAGLIHGSLHVTPDRPPYYWAGGHPRNARVVIRITRRGGRVERAVVRIALRAGWG